jgi:hypothetical protein
MKINYLCVVLFLIPLLNYAQTNVPDTLQLEIRTGQKIILIGNDLSSFKTIKTDSIIRKALSSIIDSLPGKPPEIKRPEYVKLFKRKRLFIWQPGIGAGLIRDKISPSLSLSVDFAPQRQNFYTKKWGDEYTFIMIAANTFFSFEKDITNNYHTNTNIFLEGSIGNRIFNNRVKHQFNFDEFSFGAGYLIKNEGSYFTDNSFKLFVSAIPNNSLVRLRSEILITDNFNKIFPGVALSAKLFGKTPLFQNRHIAKKNRQIKADIKKKKV